LRAQNPDNMMAGRANRKGKQVLEQLITALADPYLDIARAIAKGA